MISHPPGGKLKVICINIVKYWLAFQLTSTLCIDLHGKVAVKVLMDTFHVLLLYCSYYGKNVIFCYFTACSYENVQVLLLHFSYLWKIFMFCSVLFERVCTQNSCSALTCQNILKLPYQFCPVVYINNCISDKRVTGYVRSGYW